MVIDQAKACDAAPEDFPARLIGQIATGVLQRNQHRHDQDFAEAVPSVVLCADLSGFSVAGANLIQSDDRGAEELRRILNMVFEPVLEAIAAFGGQILQFSGDAVTAAWPVADGLADPCEQALAAGLAILHACRALKMGGDALRMRVSIAGGDVWFAHLPSAAGPGDLVLCGAVFAAFASTESTYRDGVLIVGDLWAGLPVQLSGRITRRDEPDGLRIVAVNQADPALAPRLHVAPAFHDKNAAPDWLAEFRPSNLLFARFPEFHFDPDNQSVLAALASDTSAAIAESGGMRLKFATDDKGLVLLVGWGLPDTSYENNAKRALLAAGAIRRATARRGIEASIAVTGGKVFAGPVGTALQMEYTVISDPVNPAAALSALATVDILIDAATTEAAARRFRFAEVGRAKLKGQQSDAAIYRLKSEALVRL